MIRTVSLRIDLAKLGCTHASLTMRKAALEQNSEHFDDLEIVLLSLRFRERIGNE